MTEYEIKQIETDLKTELPTCYRNALLNYPFERFSDSNGFSLSDSAPWIIKETLRYRELSKLTVYEPDVIVVGDDQDSAPYFLSPHSGQVTKAKGGHTILEVFESFEKFLAALQTSYDEIASNWSEVEYERRYGTRDNYIAFWILAMLVLLVTFVLMLMFT